MKPARPPLRAIPLSQVLPLGVRPDLYVTMSQGQWDETLAGLYAVGAVLLELDDDERPVAAYQQASDARAVTS